MCARGKLICRAVAGGRQKRSTKYCTLLLGTHMTTKKTLSCKKNKKTPLDATKLPSHHMYNHWLRRAQRDHWLGTRYTARSFYEQPPLRQKPPLFPLSRRRRGRHRHTTDLPGRKRHAPTRPFFLSPSVRWSVLSAPSTINRGRREARK